MREYSLSGGAIAATLAASFLQWGTLTSPITTPGPLHGVVHTFELTGWNGSVLFPFWVDVVGATGAALLLAAGRSRNALLLAAVIGIHLVVAGGALATDRQASIGPGLVITAIVTGVLMFNAVRAARATAT